MENVFLLIISTLFLMVTIKSTPKNLSKKTYYKSINKSIEGLKKSLSNIDEKKRKEVVSTAIKFTIMTTRLCCTFEVIYIFIAWHAINNKVVIVLLLLRIFAIALEMSLGEGITNGIFECVDGSVEDIDALNDTLNDALKFNRLRQMFFKATQYSFYLYVMYMVMTVNIK